ncbi:MAG: glycosyltransferase [Muribaculaceae bacterium]|nr:glycosyltransferase [Muribaculaceae bacterium]
MTFDIIYIVLISAIVLVALLGVFVGLTPLWRTGKLREKNIEQPNNEEQQDVLPEPVAVEEEIFTGERTDDCYVLEEEVERLQAHKPSDSIAGETVCHVPQDINPATLPSLSVVVYALCNEERLMNYIGQLMRQSYPDFEVVVVFDGTQDAASDIADVLMTRYPSLRMTFIPPGSHNLSRRKLAWTLGIKGADKEVVLTTGANTDIPSDDWLCRMAAPFANPEIDLVLGDTRFDFNELIGAGKWYHQFDRVMDNSSWISAALCGKAFRGDCYNMAFRRELFFSHNGYAASTGKPFGDDDVFVCQITDSKNTRVVITRETLLTMQWGISTPRIRTTLKEHRMFSAKMLPKMPFLRQGFFSLCNWLVFILSAATIAISLILMLPAIPWPAIAAGMLLLAYWGIEIGIYRRAAAALQAIRLWWSVPIFMLWHPIANAIFRFRHRKAKVMDFIWNGYQ